MLIRGRGLEFLLFLSIPDPGGFEILHAYLSEIWLNNAFPMVEHIVLCIWI